MLLRSDKGPAGAEGRAVVVVGWWWIGSVRNWLRTPFTIRSLLYVVVAILDSLD
jgi:hypothetical protein